MCTDLNLNQSSNTKKLQIGLFGFGCVGQGFHDVLLQSPQVAAEIKKICIRDASKVRRIDKPVFTTKASELLDDGSIDVIVELIDDAEAAFQIVKTALLNGKAVVSANKKMIATHFEELYQLQLSTGSPLLYEGAVCAAIPIIRTLESYYENDQIRTVKGIFNGTSNYILTQTSSYLRSYQEVLKEAQVLGFAESNPAMDVDGTDAKFKLILLAIHAFGVILKPSEIYNHGIQQLHLTDIKIARSLNCRIRLVPQMISDGIHVHGFVMPELIDATHDLYQVNNEFNAVLIRAEFSNDQLYYGKGAGSIPTGIAVLSDIATLAKNRSPYRYQKLLRTPRPAFDNQTSIRVYIRYRDPGIIQQLEVTEIEVDEAVDEFRYLIGRIQLINLFKLDQTAMKDCFIACVGSDHEIPIVGRDIKREEPIVV